LRIFDVSMPLRAGMPCYTGNAPYRRVIESEIAKGAVANGSRIELGAHSGTHVDAPWHFEKDGYAIDRVPTEHLVGPARVVEVSRPDCVDRADLERLDWTGVERVLLKTRNSGHWKAGGLFDPKYVYLSGPGARFLADRKMKLVGIDSLGVEQYGSKDHPAHHALLRAGVTLLEGLCLADVPPGDYELFCGPLLVEGGDGGPARALLIDRS
jgi:arylformamidase